MCNWINLTSTVHCLSIHLFLNNLNNWTRGWHDVWVLVLLTAVEEESTVCIDGRFEIGLLNRPVMVMILICFRWYEFYINSIGLWVMKTCDWEFTWNYGSLYIICGRQLHTVSLLNMKSCANITFSVTPFYFAWEWSVLDQTAFFVSYLICIFVPDRKQLFWRVLSWNLEILERYPWRYFHLQK